MKKNLILLLLVVVSCSQNSTETVKTGYDDYVPRLDAFEYSQECPHMCWLGINPGVTTIEEAETILNSTEQIDKSSPFKRSETELEIEWYTENTNTYDASVILRLDENKVGTIYFIHMVLFKVSDFMSMLGEPDYIFIDLLSTPDGGDIVQYAINYPSKKISMSVGVGGWDGPNPNDRLIELALNYEYDFPEDIEGTGIQPWLGYGQLDKYLPGQEVPSGP